MSLSTSVILTPQDAELLVRAVHPQARVTGVLARTGGQLSAVYEVSCADPEHSVIVKVYGEQWRWKQAKEVHVYGLLSAAGDWPAPTVRHVTADGPGGRAATVLSLLPGQPMSEVGATLPPADIQSIYQRLGSCLAAVHRLGQNAYGYMTTQILDPVADIGTYMRRQFAKKLREFEQLGGDASLHRALGSHVRQRADLFEHCQAAVLCHNDLHEGNVLIARHDDGWRVTGLIDVENAVAADPLLDLAKTDYYSIRGDLTKGDALLRGYGPLPDDAEDRLALYRLYHALELWDWFASIGEKQPLVDIAQDVAEAVRE